jgi:hypothetical protein
MALLRRARRVCARSPQQGRPGKEEKKDEKEADEDQEEDDERRKKDGPTGGKAMGQVKKR